jgi:hypothetical protein
LKPHGRPQPRRDDRPCASNVLCNIIRLSDKALLLAGRPFRFVFGTAFCEGTDGILQLHWLLITLTTELTYSRRLVPLFGRSDLSNTTWARLLRIMTSFIELFQQVDTAKQTNHLVLLSLDHFIRHWHLLHYAAVL